MQTNNNCRIDVEATRTGHLMAWVMADTYELTPSDFRYSILIMPYTGTQTTSVLDKYYFFPISQSSIDKNGKLEQNKDWGGTFNPL